MELENINRENLASVPADLPVPNENVKNSTICKTSMSTSENVTENGKYF